MDRKVLEFYTPEIDAAVERGIEQNRKGRFKAVVRDENGNPVKNAALRLKQKTHEFRFGANIFMLDELRRTKRTLYIRKSLPRCSISPRCPSIGTRWSPRPGTRATPRIPRKSTAALLPTAAWRSAKLTASSRASTRCAMTTSSRRGCRASLTSRSNARLLAACAKFPSVTPTRFPPSR